MQVNNVVITGASGFLGKRLVRSFLSLGFKVYAVGRTPLCADEYQQSLLENVYCPMENLRDLPRQISNDVTHFIHLAWEGSTGKERGDTELQLKNVKFTLDAVRAAKELGCKNPQIVLHLDHGDSFELCKSCIDMGFSSVMIDGSHLPYDENVALTKKVVEYAHQFDVTVEGELGVLAGVEDEVSAEHHTYTRPEEVEDFVKKTGVDSLAISIGTSHGANKFKPEQCTRNADGVLVPPPLRFDILKEIEKRIPGFPIVLHGSSSVPQDKVAIINKYGGALKDAIGIPEDQLREAAKSAVCKINIDSDGRLAMTAAVREVFANKPAEFDPRKYLGPARDALKEL